MRVLFIFHDAERNNGANHSMMDIIDYLYDNKIIDPYIVFPKRSGSAISYAINRGYKVKTMRYGRWDFPNRMHGIRKCIYGVKWGVKMILTPFAYLKLKSIIHNEGIEIVYTNTYTTFIGSMLNKALEIPHVWHIREFGKEDHDFSIVLGDRVLINALNKYTNLIIFISNSIKDKYIHAIECKEKCHVLYNDISPIRCNIYMRWDKIETINLLIAGTIQEGKGQIEAIKAVEIIKEKYPQIKLYIAGKEQGDYYKSLTQYIREKELEKNVEFVGYISDMTSLREKMHFGVICSSNEAFGRVTVEGMLTGMLMIGADAAGTKELIVDGKTGYLYHLGDVAGLAKIICNSIEHLDSAQQIAINGYNAALNTYARFYTSKKVGELLLNLVK